MSEQFYYACEDIKRQPIHFFLFFVQIIVTLLLISMMTTTAIQTGAYQKQLEGLTNLKETFLLRNQTSEEELDRLLNTDGIEKPLYEFYKYLHTNDDFSSYSYYDYPIYLGNYQHLPALHISEEFFQFFHLELESGEPFTEESFGLNGNIPLLLGASFQDQYQIGDIIGERYVVQGFLKKGAFYLSPKSTSEFLFLDNTVMVPITFTPSSDYAELHMAIDQTCIKTDSLDIFRHISEYSEQLGLFSVHFESFSSQLDHMLNDALQIIRLETAICILVLIFCLTSMVTELLTFIDNHRKEFAVHLLCGATMHSFTERIAWQIALPLLVCQTILILIYRTWQVLAVLTGTNLIILLVTLFIPILKLVRRDIHDILKRSE